MTNRLSDDELQELLKIPGVYGSMRGLVEEVIEQREEISKWKEEYSNLCKFTTSYENERDELRAEVIKWTEEFQRTEIARSDEEFSEICKITELEKRCEGLSKALNDLRTGIYHTSRVTSISEEALDKFGGKR